MLINGKQLKVVATATWSAKYGDIEGAMYIKMAFECLQKHPVDMLIFEQPMEGKLQVRSAGYDLATDSKLDETTVITTTDSLEIQKFWMKVDNYGDHYVGTFLFPNEY
jgi:hypothetical protein